MLRASVEVHFECCVQVWRCTLNAACDCSTNVPGTATVK